jgi:hypothetical protein
MTKQIDELMLLFDDVLSYREGTDSQDKAIAAFRAALEATLANIEQIERENAELRKDADRYRFIRHPALSTKQTAQILAAIDGYCEGDLDAAIDEAMK